MRCSGSITFVSSRWAAEPYAGVAAYSLSKAALSHLAMAQEMGGHYREAALTGRPQPRDGRSEAALGVVEPAAQPVGQGQLQLVEEVQGLVAVG